MTWGRTLTSFPGDTDIDDHSALVARLSGGMPEPYDVDRAPEELLGDETGDRPREADLLLPYCEIRIPAGVVASTSKVSAQANRACSCGESPVSVRGATPIA